MIDIYEYMHYEYVFVILLIIYLVAMVILKIKFGFWHNQPLSFRYSPYWWWHQMAPRSVLESGSSYVMTTQYNLSNTVTSISSGTTKAVIFPFIHNVNYKQISVYYNCDRFLATAGLSSEISRYNDIISIPFEQIAHFFNTIRPPAASAASAASAKFIEPFVDFERFSQTITNDTHGLSPFVGVYYRPTYAAGQGVDDAINEITEVQGVSVLLPRQKIEYDTSVKKKGYTTTIYVCEHFLWNPLLLTDRESLELLETTEYIQKSREIAGELTLYRYYNIPPFVVPFSTGYTYGISLEHTGLDIRKQLRVGLLLVKVSSANFNIFYNFIIECSRDFRCSIIHPISHIQHLVDSGIYHIYMLVINKTLVISAYIFGPSWTKCIEKNTSGSAKAGAGAVSRSGRRKLQTQCDRIEHIREKIAETSTALVKYLPPTEVHQYDISGKRIKSLEHTISSGDKSNKNRNKNGKQGSMATASDEIPRLISSMKHKLNCDNDIFLYGFIEASRDLTASLYRNVKSNGKFANILMIDTIAHNYILLDELNKRAPPLWIDKWYYVMYNAYIRQELLCKDLFMV